MALRIGDQGSGIRPDTRKTTFIERACRGAIVLGGAAAIMLGALSTPAGAQSSEQRMKQLEEKLNQALKTIGTLSKEVDTLKQNGGSAQTEEIESRLDDIEDVVTEMDERVGSRAVVKAFDAIKLDIGGFYDVAATWAHGDDGDAFSVNRQTFELLISAQLADDWDLFIAQAFRRRGDIGFDDAASRTDPNFQNSSDTPFVLAFANWHHSDALKVQFGRWLTPAGIINIEHFPAILLDNEQPQFLRPFGSDTMFPNFQNGLQVHGSQFMDDGSQLKYNVYAGNFSANSDMWNFGGRLGYTIGKSGFTLGLNAITGRRNNTADSAYQVYGADVLYDKGPILWKTEVWTSFEGGSASTGDRLAFYTQPAWRLDDKWTLYNRVDFYDGGANATAGTWENATGITFKPNPNVHLRLNHTFRWLPTTATASSNTLNIVQTNATLSF